MIKIFKYYKSHEMGAQQYNMITRVTPHYNIAVEILFPIRRFLFLPFQLA